VERNSFLSRQGPFPNMGLSYICFVNCYVEKLVLNFLNVHNQSFSTVVRKSVGAVGEQTSGSFTSSLLCWSCHVHIFHPIFSPFFYPWKVMRCNHFAVIQKVILLFRPCSIAAHAVLNFSYMSQIYSFKPVFFFFILLETSLSQKTFTYIPLV
jgi:hypothetical protein